MFLLWSDWFWVFNLSSILHTLAKRTPCLVQWMKWIMHSNGMKNAVLFLACLTACSKILSNASYRFVYSIFFNNCKNANVKFLVKCSFLEIYNEKILDLLEPFPEHQKTLRSFSLLFTVFCTEIREELNGVYVENLIQESITTVEDGMMLLKKGLAARKTASTAMNLVSSRSHCMFQVIVQSKEEAMTGVQKTKTSRLNLIDLAGSERQQSTQAEGDRLVEACSINKSLSALGNVINALVDVANGKSRHVHYRDSKLTFLLRDSLGGNSKTCIIANISM